MIISKEEQLERHKLVGFCEIDQKWYEFVDDLNNPASRLHSCGNAPSSRIGFQMTTQRTFNPKAKKLTKTQLKKMNGGGA